MRVLLVVFWVAVLLSLTGGTPLHAQSLQVIGVRDLRFGRLVAGVPKTVAPDDATAAGQFDIVGGKNARLNLCFILPPSMAGPLGAQIPLAFGPTDAGFVSRNHMHRFDPTACSDVKLTNRGEGSVFLGGTAQPAAGQQPGAYTGTLTLIVIVF